jgi:hypothetical protein
MKIKILTLTLTIVSVLMMPSVFAQKKRGKSNTTNQSTTISTNTTTSSNKPGLKPYREVITEKAKTERGLITVHQVDDKWFWEVPDSIIDRELLIVTRISKSATGLNNGFSGYAGDIVNNNVIRLQKGPNNKLFILRVSFDQRGSDDNGMYKAVVNSNLQPIVQAFDIKALGGDSLSTARPLVVEVTDFLNIENDILFFNTRVRTAFQLGSNQLDKSYIKEVRSYPINMEIKTVKTYSRAAATEGPSSFTIELNSSIVLLPSTPSRPRYFDPRVGFFTRDYTDFDANPQGVKRVQMAVRWKLEPKPEDIEKYNAGILVEPLKPIIFYIDPATPKKWIPYLLQGVNDWQAAFEKAGFKNAIQGRIAPTKEEDSTWSLEDARFSAIVYKPSETQNASGPNVHDPRSGEILESHINWYHNVMQLLRNWYFIQAAPNDKGAQKMIFDDELMGRLIRFVSAHEVGHTLGLRHNFGSSSTVPVDSLRNKSWLEKNRHTPSIMDYARFNYVAQPEDNIPRELLMPQIGEYDMWAIEWGYRWYPQYKTAEEEAIALTKMTTERLKNRRLWFGTEINPDDPRSQSEDLGNNSMKASMYGIKNLQRIVPNLLEWSRMPHEDYESLSEMYGQVVSQYGRYMGHVAKNIGGIFETPRMNEENTAVYEYTPKKTQQEAMNFLSDQLFTTPKWLIQQDILNKTGGDIFYIIGNRQDIILGRLLNATTLNKLYRAETALGANAYKATDLMNDLRRSIFSELYSRTATDIYRRNLQKMYTERLIALLPAKTTSLLDLFSLFSLNQGLSAKNEDTYSLVKGNLLTLRNDIRQAIPLIADPMTKLHLQDLEDRIERALDPR